LSGLLDAACPPGPTNATCVRTFRANVQGHAVFANGIPGPKGEAAVAHFLKVYSGVAGQPTTPISLINFGQAVNFPLILGFMLALFGVATLLHLLVVSVARRRYEIGLLKALGFVRAQIRAAVCWQATTVALFGIVVGIPLGVAAGQLVWRTFATNLGDRTGVADRIVGCRRPRNGRTVGHRAGAGGDAIDNWRSTITDPMSD
jgi:hypothetical protein